MSSSMYEHPFDREPDLIEGSPDHRRMLRLWMPDVEHGGLAILDGKHSGKPNEPSQYEGISLIDDVNDAARTLQGIANGLPALYSYLGVRAEHTATQATLSFPHGETLIRRLGALPLPDSARPPGFALQPDGIYSPTTYLTHLARHKTFIMAANGPYAVHDLITHAFPAQMLVPPEEMNALSALAQETLAKEDETAAGRLMGRLDGGLSYVGYGRRIAEVLKTGTDPYTSNEGHWEEPLLYANPSYRPGPSWQRGRQLRSFCLGLNQVAQELSLEPAQ
jgi:hypothetical protein